MHFKQPSLLLTTEGGFHMLYPSDTFFPQEMVRSS